MNNEESLPVRGRRLQRAVVAVAVAIGLLSVTAPPAMAAASDDTVTGTFRYRDSSPSDGSLRPIAHAKVEIWRYAPRSWGVWSWGNDATVFTNGSGVLSASMPHSANGVVYGLRVFATNYAAVVWPNDAAHSVPFHQEPGQPDGAVMNLTATGAGQTLDFSYDFTDSWTPQHYNLAETIRRGRDFVDARRDPAEGDPVPQADVQPTSASSTWYNAGADTVVITSGDVFSDFLILHEYGHFVEEQISSLAWLPSNHDGCTARDVNGNVMNSAEHAWMEGFADFFAQAVGRFVPAGTLSGTGTLGSTPGVGTLESPTCVVPAGFGGDTVENFVAGSMWDLLDLPGEGGAANENSDRLGRFDKEVLQILDRELDVYGTWPTIWQFRNAWAARGLSAQALDRILAANRIPVASPPNKAVGYDADLKADTSVWRPGGGYWHVINSSTGQGWSRQWGLNGDVPVPGDYDGDGLLDTAVWRPSNGVWYVVNSSTGQAWSRQWGLNGDVPVPGDYDGDGRTDTAVWRPSNGVWYVVNSSTGQAWSRQWGLNGDIPVPADFDGDGRTDTAVWRPSGGHWHVVNSSTGQAWSRQWGTNGDVPVPADHDGDSRADTGVWRPSGGHWHVVNSSTGQGWSRQWGTSGDVPLARDFDGDGRADAAAWKPSTGTWTWINTSTGLGSSRQWGTSGDRPVA